MKMTPEIKTWYGLVATFGTVGRFTKMPGTMGSIAACAVWLAAGTLPLWVIALTALIGTVAADLYEKNSGREDPGEVVIDEVVGLWLACWGLPVSYAIAGLVLFRIIDITKPFPVCTMEKLPGGIGIMADDIVGGIISNLLIRGIQWLLFTAGGITLINKIAGI